MELSQQVCTIIQAKRLKELGVVQSSIACYIGEELHLFEKSFYDWAAQKNLSAVAAFTVAELGVMIGWDYVCTFYAYGFWHWCDLRNEEPMIIAKSGKRQSQNEAEARCNMLIYLLENNLTTPEEVNNRLQQF